MADEEMALGDGTGVNVSTGARPSAEGQPRVENTTAPEEGQPDDPDFRHDAKIWSLYMREASDQAAAQAELWKTGLDSLLLFAGLFAGVVSAFVIESRKKLRMDDQELLLHSINNALRGQPPAEDSYKPTTDHLWINGLWFGSLLITLFSAILGVLAKSWLVKYTPLSTRDGQQSEDAYQRWTIDQRAKTWKLEWAFTLIPLLVQIAFLLFAAGLSIQCFNDQQTLGRIILGLIALGMAVYIVATILPLLLPDGSCPFQTPLSEILIQLRGLFRWSLSGRWEAATPSTNKGDRHKVLGTIWAEKLIKSRKQDYVDEAIAEIARRPLTSQRLKFFADFDTPNTVIKRLERCMTSEYQEDPRRNEIISNHLLALSRFIVYSEKASEKHIGLMSTLEYSLDSKSPLGRWNFFTEPTLPLAFSIRVPLLLAFDLDIAITEVSEQPWEQLARALKPNHRLRFVLSSCRALATGRENLRKTSSLSIATCMALAMKSGSRSEWGSVSQDKQAALDLVRWCIIRVCKEIAYSWEGEALEYWMAYLSIGTIEEIESNAQLSSFPRSLDAALKHSKTIYRRQAVSIILSMVNVVDPKADIAHVFLPNLIQRALSDDSSEVRAAAIDALKDMARKDVYKPQLSERLQQLANDPQLFYWQRVAELLTSLTGLVLPEVLEPILLGLVREACRKYGVFSQLEATLLLERMVQKPKFQEELETTIRARVIEDLNKGWRAREAVFKDIDQLRSLCATSASELFTGKLFKTVIMGLAGRLVTCAMIDGDEDVRKAGQAVVGPLLEMEPPIDDKANIVLQLEKGIFDALSSIDWSIRHDAIQFLSKHISQSTFVNLIRNTIPSITELILTDYDSDVREAAMAALENMANHSMFTLAIQTALFVDLERYTVELDANIQKRFISVIEQLILKGSGREDQTVQGLKYLLDVSVQNDGDDDKDIRDAGIKALISLCNSSNLLSTVKAELGLKTGKIDQEEAESGRWIELLIYLMRIDSLRDTCFAVLQSGLTERPQVNPLKFVEGSEIIGSAFDLNHHQNNVDQSGNNATWPLLAHLVCRQDVQQSTRMSALKTLHFILNEQDRTQPWESFRGLDNGVSKESNPEIYLSYLHLLATATKKDESTEAFKTAIARHTQDLKTLFTSISLESWETRVECAKVLGALAANGYLAEGIHLLVTMVVKDEDTDVREASLTSLAEVAVRSSKNQSSVQAIITGLGKKFNSILSIPSDSERMTWVSVLCALSIHATESDVVRQKLVDLAIKDDDVDVRVEAFKGVHKLILDSKLREGSIGALVNGFKLALRGSHWSRYQVVESLQVALPSMASLFDLDTVLQPLVSVLIKVALNDQDDVVREAAERLLTSLITHEPAAGPLQPDDTGIRSTILSAVTDNIGLFSDRDKLVALRLIEAIPKNITDDVVSPFAQRVIHLLKTPHVPTRATALEILTILYRQGIARNIIRPNLSDIVTLALEDDYIGNQVIALELLTSLCSDETLRQKIQTAQPTLMSFLENRDLRPITVELISLLAQDQKVRWLVADWILSVIATDSEPQIEGMVALLLRLVLEKRLDAQPKGPEILFFLAPAFVLRRSLAKSRTRLTALLWVNYQEFMRGGLDYRQEVPQPLIDSLVASVFGHHVAQHELDEWMGLRGCLEPKGSGETQRSSALPSILISGEHVSVEA
ncbi:armadillo-type protein [Coprinopsis sp. MPI-PUGE-AT-0042]|nr:armadillo-type protein [Coprinopsis sp. MPI-PUGE-AT-0042]